MRRFTRLTNAHSKKLANHKHAVKSTKFPVFALMIREGGVGQLVEKHLSIINAAS